MLSKTSPLIELEIMQQGLTTSSTMSRHLQIAPAFINLNYADDLRTNLKYYPGIKIVSGAYKDTIGVRGSKTFFRIYDKIAEQKKHKFEVPADYKSWVRFEMEFHRENACSVLSDYATAESDEAFAARIASVAMGHLRFIEIDHSRIYN